MIRPTHMCYSDACTEADDSSGLNSMKLGQDPARVRGQCGQDLTVTETHTVDLLYRFCHTHCTC